MEKTEKGLAKSKDGLDAALRASKIASVPNRFDQEAQKHNLKLKFPTMLAKKKKLRGDLEEAQPEFEGHELLNQQAEAPVDQFVQTKS